MRGIVTVMCVALMVAAAAATPISLIEEDEAGPARTVACSEYKTCSECASSYSCGWCRSPQGGNCTEGHAMGPLSGHCDAWDYSYCMGDICSQLTTCSECLQQDFCGWCGDACMAGDLKGPLEVDCDPYFFRTCDEPEPPVDGCTPPCSRRIIRPDVRRGHVEAKDGVQFHSQLPKSADSGFILKGSPLKYAEAQKKKQLEAAAKARAKAAAEKAKARAAQNAVAPDSPDGFVLHGSPLTAPHQGGVHVARSAEELAGSAHAGGEAWWSGDTEFDAEEAHERDAAARVAAHDAEEAAAHPTGGDVDEKTAEHAEYAEEEEGDEDDEDDDEEMDGDEDEDDEEE